MSHQIKMIEVPYEWIESEGKGVRIAVVDTHIDENSDVFIKNVSKYHKNSNGGIYDSSHCTSVCQIIAYASPLCDISVYQLMVNGEARIDSLVSIVEILLKENFDIINFSFSTSIDNSILKEKIDELSKKSIIICSVDNHKKKSFPASYKNVVSVASFINSSMSADMYAPDIFDINGIKKTGNSMSTAFVTGIFSLAKSYNKNFTRLEIIKQLLEI